MFKLSENSASRKDLESADPLAFSPEQRKILLAIAHEAISAKSLRQPFPDWRATFSNATELWIPINEPRGVFTTLYLQGQLRGCVGYPAPVRPLYQAVAETACAAAFEDSRFWPIASEEVADLKVSLSVLSPLFPIEPDQIEVGRHGLVISDGLRRGLLLPQVPIEHNWDRQVFLEQTCHKAGLPTDAWKRKDVSIQAFTAEVFGDDQSLK